VESAKFAASDLIAAGAKAVVIKLGAGGVWVYGEGGSFGNIPGPSQYKLLDTTAAGDAFSGGPGCSPV